MGTGLQRILKLYGKTTVSANGKTVVWLWDYANDVPVMEKDMPFGSARHAASERAKFQLLAGDG